MLLSLVALLVKGIMLASMAMVMLMTPSSLVTMLDVIDGFIRVDHCDLGPITGPSDHHNLARCARWSHSDHLAQSGLGSLRAHAILAALLGPICMSSWPNLP